MGKSSRQRERRRQQREQSHSGSGGSSLTDEGYGNYGWADAYGAVDDDEIAALQAWYDQQGGNPGAAPLDDRSWSNPSSVRRDDDDSLFTREEILEEITNTRLAILGIDKKVKADHPNNKEAQNKAAKDLLRELERDLSFWEREYGKLARAAKSELRTRGGRDYGLVADDDNIAITQMMDRVIRDAQTRMADLKDEVAARIREGMAVLEQQGIDIQAERPRNKIYEDLVDAGIIQTFEPTDINF